MMEPTTMALIAGPLIVFILCLLLKPTPKPSPTPYFTPFQKVVNYLAPIAIPFLVSLSPIFKPIYMVTDILLLKRNRAPGGPSNECKPVVVFCSRTVKNVASYKAAWKKYAESMQKNSAGVRACFSFMDRDKKSTALQFLWLDTPSDYVPPPPELTDCYGGSSASSSSRRSSKSPARSPPETDYCQIWGGWDAALQASLGSLPGLKCSFVADMRGFIKSPSASYPGKPGFATGVTPMIWISKRNVKPGRMASCGKHFQLGTDLMYYNAPPALAICEYTSPEEPDALWSLRVFNDFEGGFKAHFPVPSFILFRMVWNVIPEWVPGLFPIGFNFSTKAYIDGAVSANPGNKSYAQYHFESERLGPMPDFGKGF